MENIHIQNVLEKRFLLKLFHNIYVYVGDTLSDETMELWIAQRRVVRVAPNTLPISLSRYPVFYAGCLKYLTTGHWSLMMPKWNLITPLPLPG